MVAGLVVQSLDSLPEDIEPLLSASQAEGHNLVRRLVDEWNDGSNRFDGPGEAVFEARVGSCLAAVGGLNRDPYLEDAEVARIRHVYVAPDMRGVGVGRALVLAMVDHARLGFRRVRLRTVTPEGSAFYLALGFESTPSEADATHGWRL